MADETGERWDEDPGWRVDGRVLLLMVPGMLQRQLKRGGGDGLRATRDLFASFVMSSDASLVGDFRTRFFLRVAIARMLSQAPTPAALVRDQDELSANGCSRSLVAALRHPSV